MTEQLKQPYEGRRQEKVTIRAHESDGAIVLDAKHDLPAKVEWKGKEYLLKTTRKGGLVLV